MVLRDHGNSESGLGYLINQACQESGSDRSWLQQGQTVLASKGGGVGRKQPAALSWLQPVTARHSEEGPLTTRKARYCKRLQEVA
ncbi:hypothetical protein NDU88_004750 [Pleurodeles waltl]|uniref:Uncharacterized protein n=1 Tax=Pleurodeles waltl TaxID=8319 RepID=A0AAV7TTG8_PLEWA|nr:hypothetical protein NDU88_004750 [Pleurodeles waltl]